MRNTTIELEKYLNDLSTTARAGDKLPTVRELMRRFGLSQMSVQRVFHDMRARGLVDSQVGRGTFFLLHGPDAGEPRDGGESKIVSSARAESRSVLLLRRSISIARGRVLIEKLHERFVANGQKVLEVSYSDPNHARAVLKGLPRFDACVVQSTYRPIPIEVLAAIRDKTDVIAVDGTALVGADVEAVGTEWGEPLAEATQRLLERGHKKIAFAATSRPLLATQLGFRRWEYLEKGHPDISFHTIKVPLLPDEDYVQSLVAELMVQIDDGRLPFSALIVWGVEDGARFRRMLMDLGVSIPEHLSVVLLGRTDLPNERGGFFEIVGSSIDDQVEALYQAINDRWLNPSLPYGVRLTRVTRKEGASVANPIEVN